MPRTSLTTITPAASALMKAICRAAIPADLVSTWLPGYIPALVGIHRAIDDDLVLNYSLDTLVPAYIDAIQAAMVGETLTLIPEPASAAFLALGGMAVIGLARRVRQPIG
ncbi:MAG: PEP-CTERM sorting domain-containing protein [Paludibaculum sp.]